MQTQENIPAQFIRSNLPFVKEVTVHQWTPATHVLVFMISGEDQRKKPYALPVQCIPYKDLIIAKIRKLANNITSKMVKLKINLQVHRSRSNNYIQFFLGLTVDRECNPLCCKGTTRPTSVFQIHADIRAKFSRIGIKRITLTRMCITCHIALCCKYRWWRWKCYCIFAKSCCQYWITHS